MSCVFESKSPSLSMRVIIFALTVLLALSCSGGPNTDNTGVKTNKTPNTVTKQGPLPVSSYEVVRAYPHDQKAFTEGLYYHDGSLYESTGQEKQSTLRKVDLETGKVLQKVDLPPESFGEGISLVGDRIFQLTWEE